MIDSARIVLRPWQETDIPAMMALRNNVALQAKLLSVAKGSNELQVREWLENRSDGSDRRFFVLADFTNNAPIGYLQIINIDPVNLNAELGICLAPEAQGKGYGSEALRLAFSLLIKNTDLRKISLQVRVDNDAAIRCYEKLGFAKCGCLSDHVFLDGKWWDVLIMELFLSPKN
ncbi:MAG: GNAT family protein [Arenimonas sp.]